MADQRSARGRLFQRAEDRTPVADRRFGEGSYLRPSFIQPYRCRDVLIEDCTFTTGDDGIAINSGRNEDVRRVGAPAENIVIRFKNNALRGGILEHVRYGRAVTSLTAGG